MRAALVPRIGLLVFRAKDQFVGPAEWINQYWNLCPRCFLKVQHIERNIDSINGVADHVDELYLADLSEKSNEKTASLSNRLAAVSLILALLALPSFWADWMAVHETWTNELLYIIYLVLGTSLGLGLALVAIFLLVKAWWQRRAVKASG